MCGIFNDKVGEKVSSLLAELKEEKKWEEYLDHKLTKGHLTKKELSKLEQFINSKSYLTIVDNIICGEGLSIPIKKQINKNGSTKKRVVYSFNDGEVWVLKLLSYLLYRYDDKQPLGCYSFRKGYGAYRAISSLSHTKDIAKMWAYKLDIKDYFNSIDIEILLPILKSIIEDDEQLYEFLMKTLIEDKADCEGSIIEEKRGVMAGTPVSPFLANIYLREVDNYFVEKNIPYARYSDDIIIFGESENDVLTYQAKTLEFMKKYNLEVNKSKEKISGPNEPWEFLGIAFCNHKIDLSTNTKNKLKGKIRRKARAIRRWMIKNNADETRAMKAIIRSFNRKFFENTGKNELTWSKWFFPIVTEDTGFKEIDGYLQQYIRYIATGRHNKKNYLIKYDDLKEMGYNSLVNEYYRFKRKTN